MRLLNPIYLLRQILRYLLLVVVATSVVMTLLYLLGRGGYPRHWVEGCARALSTPSLRVTVGGIRYAPLSGITLHHLTIAPVGDTQPLFTLGRARLRLKPALSWRGMLRRLEIRDATLFDHPKASSGDGGNFENIELPSISRLPITLENVEVFGIRADHISLQLSTTPHRLRLEDVRVRWAESLRQAPWLDTHPNPQLARPGEQVKGVLWLDLPTGLLEADLEGSTRPDRLWSLFKLLDLPVVEEYCRDFQFAEELVANATCHLAIGVSESNATAKVDLAVNATNITFRGVPFEQLSGTILVDGRETTITNLYAYRSDAELRGNLYTTSQTHQLEFSAESTLPPQQIGEILQVLQEPISNISFQAGTRIQARGGFITKGVPLSSVTLSGRIATGEGMLWDLPVQRLETELSLTNCLLGFSSIRLETPSQGIIEGDSHLSFQPNLLFATNRLELIHFTSPHKPIDRFGPLTGNLNFSLACPLTNTSQILTLHLTNSLLRATNSLWQAEELNYSYLRDLVVSNFALRSNQQPILSANYLRAQLTTNATIASLYLSGLQMDDLPTNLLATTSQEGVTATLPSNPAFPLIIDNLSVLDVAADRLTARVANTPERLMVDDLTINWSRPNHIVAGGVTVDWVRDQISANLRARLTPEVILPLFPHLDLPIVTNTLAPLYVLPEGVLEASCQMQFSLDEKKPMTRLELPVRARQITYHGVPFDILSLHLSVQDDLTTISHLRAARPDAALRATLTADGARHLLTFEGKSSLPLRQLATVLDLPLERALSPLEAPRCSLEARGHFSTEGATLPSLSLEGEILIPEGRLAKIPYINLTSSIDLTNATLSLPDVRLCVPTGGVVHTSATLHLQQVEQEASNLPFTLQTTIQGFPLQSLEAYAENEKARQLFGTLGVLNGEVTLSGNLGATNILATLDGRGHLGISGGRINRIPLFAGLTDYMARNLPGVEGLVDQTVAHADLTFKNGVMSTENGDIHGSVFGVRMHGNCDLPSGQLDLRARAVFFKENSFWRRVSSILTYPLSKLFMEFRLGGTIEQPTWSYIGLWDRSKLD